MALRGIRVLELAGLAPGPFCGMILSDFGASVIRIDRVKTANTLDRLARGKRSIAVNLKDPKGQAVVERLATQSDVIIEPFRPGVMEKLNLGPEQLMSRNPGLIYARLSGYGQTGPYAFKAGHDINYVAISGVLSRLGRADDVPTPPINMLADFAGGGLLCAFGIVMSLFERRTSRKGQIVDASMTEGAAYVSSWLFKGQDLPVWGKDRGENVLDSGAPFYDTFETKDEKYMAVGALEPQFYARLMEGLNLNLDQYTDYIENRKLITEKFLTKTQAEWIAIFEHLDACVTPVPDLTEAQNHEQNKFREAFVHNPHTKYWEPQPAPRLSRTPGQAHVENADPVEGQHTVEVLREFEFDSEAIRELIDSGAVESHAEFKAKL